VEASGTIGASFPRVSGGKSAGPAAETVYPWLLRILSNYSPSIW